MTDTCRVYRTGGIGVFDPDTGTVTGAETELYNGRCRVKQVPGYKTGGEEVGESIVPRTAPIISVPHGENAILAGDRVEILTSDDESLIGRPLIVQAVHAGTHATARRLICEGLN
jgi:hypothetical protein